MSQTRSKLDHKSPWILSLLSGIFVFLSFEKFNLPLLSFAFPIVFNWLSFQKGTLKTHFLWGFLTSFVIMLGGFYWVTHVIHEFGYVPWSLSALIFLAFSGFGALNFPIFFSLAAWLNNKIKSERFSPFFWSLWFTLFLPALFCVVEYFFPKIFPWYLGHCLYRWSYATQIVELTGSLFLSFSIYSLGSGLGLLFFAPVKLNRKPWEALLIPMFLWVISLGFGFFRINHPPPQGKTLNISIIQANIGSLEKIQSENGVRGLVDKVLAKYIQLTELALKSKPDLIVWPETAVPYLMGTTPDRDRFLSEKVLQWKTPLLTGGYARSTRNYFKDYNGAFLLSPTTDGKVTSQNYMKNILLAFGEYFPLGDYFPILYKYFPQVADFERGQEQNPLYLQDGTPLGVTICYEAIVPSFFRKTAKHPILAVINLTNDSWFGPTSEPFLHGSLAVFRSLETKLPLIRATNTGISFTVDSLGKRSSTTALYGPDILNAQISLPATHPETIYLKYGDWFVVLLILVQCLFALYLKVKF